MWKIIKQKQINPIPESIKIHTKNRWFFLYKWLTIENLKLSMWKDIKNATEIFMLSFPVLFFISLYISFPDNIKSFSINKTYVVLWFVILIFSIIFFLALILISLKTTKSFILNSYLIITDKFIFIWWKKLKLSLESVYCIFCTCFRFYFYLEIEKIKFYFVKIY